MSDAYRGYWRFLPQVQAASEVDAEREGRLVAMRMLAHFLIAKRTEAFKERKKWRERGGTDVIDEAFYAAAIGALDRWIVFARRELPQSREQAEETAIYQRLSRAIESE